MSPLERTFEALATQAATRQGASQIALIVAGLVLGWLVSGVLRRRVAAQQRWKFGSGGFDRVAFPLTALALLWGARLLLRKAQATPFVDLAIALLVAFAVIRFAVYVLRHILPDGAFLRGSERTIAITMWAGVALYLTGILPEVRDALDEISFNVGKQRISLLLVIQGLVSVAITLAISMWIARVVESRVLAADRVELSTRVVIAKLVRAVAFTLAILVALPIVGIDITALSVFGGALGVGIGFGLQKIASNYVSGYIILLDRSIRIGDLVTVDNRHGVVKEIAVALHGDPQPRRHGIDHSQRDDDHPVRDQPLVHRPQGAGQGEGDRGLRLRHRPRLRPAARGRAAPAPGPRRSGARRVDLGARRQRHRRRAGRVDLGSGPGPDGPARRHFPGGAGGFPGRRESKSRSRSATCGSSRRRPRPPPNDAGPVAGIRPDSGPPAGGIWARIPP